MNSNTRTTNYKIRQGSTKKRFCIQGRYRRYRNVAFKLFLGFF